MTSTKRSTSAALVMISALPVANEASRTSTTAGAGDQARGVQLREDAGHAQQPVQADSREQQAQVRAARWRNVQNSHQNGPPRMTWRAATSVAVNDSGACASAASM